MEKPILELKNVTSGYNEIQVLKNISLKAFKGEIVAVIGGNGAGKTTMLMTISNIVPVTSGEILYYGEPIHKKPADILPGIGLCQAPEGRRIFPRLSVEDNLEMGAFLRRDYKEINKDIEYIYQLFPILKDRKKQPGGALSGGEQQMLAIGRAMMGRPKLLLLDEPSLGLAPLIVLKIFEIIEEINKKGTTVLLVEQNANLSLKIAKRGYVMETGKIIAEDDANVLLNNKEIKKAYLGVSE
ncbi:MAG: ABC transporter ATP-binding protein [Deltaproteobacteria bacterium]|nr:ABC transporter ATP-binding protein [Deltaproteobacteria bacterium]